MAAPRKKDTTYDLEITSLDELERSVVAGEDRAPERPSERLAPASIERNRRCETSQRELLRNRLRFEVE